MQRVEDKKIEQMISHMMLDMGATTLAQAK